MKRILLFMFYTYIVAVDLNMERNSKCTNPYGKSGTCVPLTECQEIYDVAARKNGIDVLFATKSRCGTDEEVLVCCEHAHPIKVNDLDVNLLLGNKECGVVKNAEQLRISGGVLAGIGEFPWLVGIEYVSRGTDEPVELRCGGVLISNEYVLTVAHCISEDENDYLELIGVRLGEWDTTTDPDCQEAVANKFCADPIKSIGILEVIIHPFYSRRNSLNDVGLIRLGEKVTFTDYISPICLPYRDVSISEENEQLVTAGWGVTETLLPSDILRKVTITTASQNKCAKWRHYVDRHSICAGGEKGEGSCQADSGNPLMKSHNDESNGTVWYVHGLASSGVGCSLQSVPGVSGVYMNVTYYTEWIVRTVIEYSKVGL